MLIDSFPLSRINIGNAVIYGLENDLNLVGTQYNTALTVFFVPYIVFEIPSNIILRRLKPHVWCQSCHNQDRNPFLTSLFK